LDGENGGSAGQFTCRHLLYSARNYFLADMSEYDSHQQQRGGMALVAPRVRPRRQVQKPRLYKVMLLNDDFTPMEFVVMVLMEIFFHPQEEAVQIMLHVHRKGAGVCGVYPSEVAETKVRQVNSLTRKHQHPLRCVMEPE